MLRIEILTYFMDRIFKKCIYKYGDIHIWDSHILFSNRKWLDANVKQKLTDLFIYDFHANINHDSKYSNYRLFKTTLENLFLL